MLVSYVGEGVWPCAVNTERGSGGFVVGCGGGGRGAGLRLGPVRRRFFACRANRAVRPPFVVIILVVHKKVPLVS